MLIRTKNYITPYKLHHNKKRISQIKDKNLKIIVVKTISFS